MSHSPEASLLAPTFPVAPLMGLGNSLHVAPVLFANTFLSISKTWGTTGVTLGYLEPAAMMLVASEDAGAPWLLLKNNQIFVVTRFIADDPSDVYFAAEPEPIMALVIDGVIHRVHFPDAASFWAFRYHALHGGGLLERERSSLFTREILASAWEHFEIPINIPRCSFQRF